MSINKVILVGNIGSDPKFKTFKDGTMVANFSLATSETYTTKAGEKKTDTEWHNISVIGKSAKFIEDFSIGKGRQVYVEGKLKTRFYEKDGQKIYITEVHKTDFKGEFKPLGRKQEGAGTQQAAPDIPESEPESDLPF